MKLGLLVLVVCVSQNCFSSDVYKCIDAQGKKIFSDKPCPKDTNETKLKHKKTALEDQLVGSAPGKSKVIDVTTVEDETLVEYQFGSQAELQEFMRISSRLSGKSVNLLNVVIPHGETKGRAKLQITAKDNGLFKTVTNR